MTKSQKQIILGSKYAHKIILQTLSHFPKEIIDFVAKNVTFISSFDDATAYTLQKSDIKSKYVIVVSDELLTQDEKQIIYTLAHEIGHTVLGHRNAFYKPQTKQAIKKQEKEASEFARRVIYV